jgi:hypothetical protein
MSRKREDDDFSEDDFRTFTPDERKKLRKLIVQEERIQWFWGTLRVWATWISGTVVATYSIFEILRNLWWKH